MQRAIAIRTATRKTFDIIEARFIATPS